MFHRSKDSLSENSRDIGAEIEGVLVERSARGDLEAFGQLVGRHDRRISALVTRLLGHSTLPAESDALVLAVFAQVWRTLPRRRSQAEFPHFLSRIAVEQALKQRKRAVGQAQVLAPEALPVTVGDALVGLVPGAADTAALRVRDIELQVAIDRLPEEQRTSVLLHFFEDYSCPDVAKILGLSEDAVWTHLHTACRRLAETASWLRE